MSEFEGVTLYYFTNFMNRPDCGRAEPVRLLLTDAGIDFQYERFPKEKWLIVKKELIEGGSREAILPYMITKSGKLYTRVAPIMRRVSKVLGKYIPKDEYDEYLVDAYSDITLDWRTKWVQRYFIDMDRKDVQESYAEELASQYLNWNNILGDRGGPYVFGQEITHVDFELYSMLREDDELVTNIKDYPNIIKFIKVIEARPAIQVLFTQADYPKKL